MWDRRGFTLLEIVIVVALTGTLALVSYRLSTDVTGSNQLSDVALVRDEMATQARAMAASLPQIRASLADPGNAYLKGCVCGNGPCTTMQSQDFFMFDSTGKTLESPKYFNAQGVACSNSAKNNCPLQVKMTAMAECGPASIPNVNLNPAWKCGTLAGNASAEFIQIAYSVGPNPAYVAPNLNSASINPNPTASGSVLNSVAGTTYFMVSDVKSLPPLPVAPNPPVCP